MSDFATNTVCIRRKRSPMLRLSRDDLARLLEASLDSLPEPVVAFEATTLGGELGWKKVELYYVDREDIRAIIGGNVRELYDASEANRRHTA